MHGRGDLLFEQILDLVLVERIEITGHIGHQRQPRRGDVHPIQHLAQGSAGRGDNAGVEGVADRQLHCLIAPLLEQFDGRFDGLACAADDGLGVAVDVRRDNVTVHFFQGRFDNFIRSQHSRHPAVIIDLYLRHFATAPGGRFQRFGKGQDARRHQRAVFAKRVTHHQIGLEPVIGEQPANGLVHRQHGRLGDLRLHQVQVGLADGAGILRIDEQIGRQRSAEDGLHDRVGLIESPLNRRRYGGQLLTHVDVLAALSREEESKLARLWPAAAENALCFHGFPGLRCVEAHDLACLV